MKDVEKISKFCLWFFIIDFIAFILLYILFEILDIDGDVLLGFMTNILPLTVLGVCDCLIQYDYSKKKKLTGFRLRSPVI